MILDRCQLLRGIFAILLVGFQTCIRLQVDGSSMFFRFSKWVLSNQTRALRSVSFPIANECVFSSREFDWNMGICNPRRRLPMTPMTK